MYRTLFFGSMYAKRQSTFLSTIDNKELMLVDKGNIEKESTRSSIDYDMHAWTPSDPKSC